MVKVNCLEISFENWLIHGNTQRNKTFIYFNREQFFFPKPIHLNIHDLKTAYKLRSVNDFEKSLGLTLYCDLQHLWESKCRIIILNWFGLAHE